MRKPINMLDDDDFDAISTDLPMTATRALAQEALAHAMTPRINALLDRGACLLLVRVPDVEWVEPINDALRASVRGIFTRTAIAPPKSKDAERMDGDFLRALEYGRRVAYITQDPEGILDASVLSAVDATVTIVPPTPALVRAVIGKISGQSPRGVTAEMAALPLPDLVAAIRTGLSARDCLQNLARAALGIAQASTRAAPTVPLLQDLPLTAAMRSWTTTTLDELDAVKTGTMPPDHLVYGVLEGPPGTGKSLIAESVARSSGWSFVSSSVGDWFTTGDGALGGVARNAKAFVDEILNSTPAVGFLDEIDGLPDRATMQPRDASWWTPIVNLVLVEIDRLRRSGKPILLLGATNHYARLDKALVRPGRLQQRITVLPPQTDDEVASVLNHYVREDLTGNDLAILVRLARGATPAMIEGWVKEARGAARAADRALRTSDIVTQIVPRDTRSAADVRAIAIHEAGHAIVARALGHQVERISIIPGGGMSGHTLSAYPTVIPTLESIHDTVTVMLGGRAADTVLGIGANAAAEADLEAATRTLLDASTRQGLGDSLTYAPAVTGKPSAAIAREIDADLRRLLTRASQIIEARQHDVLSIAGRLLEAKLLDGHEVEKALGPTTATGPHPMSP